MDKPNRREFLRRAGALAGSAGLGGAFLSGCTRKTATPSATPPPPSSGPAKVADEGETPKMTELSGPEKPSTGSTPAGVKVASTDVGGSQLVCAHGGESPGALVRAAIETLGGMAAVGKAGQTVCLKPNASWDRTPKTGANTDPELMSEVVKMCKEAGAKEVVAVDYTLASDPLTFNELGAATEDAGGTFIELRKSDEAMFDVIEYVPGLKALPKFLPEEKAALDAMRADVLINIPVLKSHSATGLALGMKNLMGLTYNRSQYHGQSGDESSSSETLHLAIADLGILFKPRIALTIVDACYVMRSEAGPRGRDDEDGDPMFHVLAGTDIVACDAQAAMLYGLDQAELATKVPYITAAADAGVGSLGPADVSWIEA